MSILNDVILQEIKELIKEEVRKEENQLKLEDAKVITEVLLQEIDKIITTKINKIVRKIATEVISWDLVSVTEETSLQNNQEYSPLENPQKPTLNLSTKEENRKVKKGRRFNAKAS